MPFEILARHGLIDAGLATDLGRATAVLNRIAHGYASLDLDRIHRELPAGLHALDRFAAAIAGHAGPRDGE